MRNDLVTMVKDSVVAYVIPDQVAAMVSSGWEIHDDHVPSENVSSTDESEA